MYWIDMGNDGTYDGLIRRANLDGSEVEDLLTRDLFTPRGLVLDLVERKMYWADDGDDSLLSDQ